MGVIGQVQTSLNFYTYGRGEFTQDGYEKHAKKYEQPDFHDHVDLSGKVFMVTGANSGLGRELTKYLASKNATVYMVCRSPEKAETARDEISQETGNEQLRLIIADVGLQGDVRRAWDEFVQRQDGDEPRLDGLVCNAGPLLNKRTLNDDGVETTFAVHLAIGTYLLGKLAMPTLEATEGSRFLIVTSGGMYNSKFPSWETATSTAQDSEEEYDGNLQYTYAKRGQVIVAERWAEQHPKVKIMSAHPGWASTSGVTASLSDKKHLLEPLRTAWQGVEGMAWLLACPAEEIESGEVYLDRSPTKKHMSGAFWTEGHKTKNSDDEEAMLMLNLERFTNNSGALHDVWRPTPERTAAKLASRQQSDDLEASAEPIAIDKFMGKWNVVANIPISALKEQTFYNPVENYAWDADKERIDIVYNYYTLGTTETGEARQHGHIKDKRTNTTWALNPKLGLYLPLGLGYLVLYCAPDYSWTLIGVPDRKYLWVMTRARPAPKEPAPWPADADKGAMQEIRAQEKAAGLKETDGGFLGETVLTQDEEDRIMQQALLKAEACGYDISQVRLAGWFPEIPYL